MRASLLLSVLVVIIAFVAGCASSGPWVEKLEPVVGNSYENAAVVFEGSINRNRHGLPTRNNLQAYHVDGRGWAYGNRYDEVGRSSEGLAYARLNGKEFHIFAATGYPAYKALYDEVGVFVNGLSWARLGNKELVICTDGEPVEYAEEAGKIVADCTKDRKPGVVAVRREGVGAEVIKNAVLLK